MRFVRRYLIPRLIQYVGVTVLGVTVIFFIPRLLPGGPIEGLVAGITARGQYLNPEAAEEIVRILREMYGLQEGLFEQYVSFWRRLFTGDFGPSLTAFPVPVIELIGRALPWTFGLLLTTTVFTFIFGNILGGLAGYFKRSGILKIIDGIVMVMAPIPYYLVALMLVIVLAYLIPIFPIGGAYTIGMTVSFTWPFVTDVLKHAFLPALSLVLLGSATTHQIMRLIVQSVTDEDYVRFAKIGNVKERIIFSRYVMRNAMLPQITRFALGFATLFSGALITEMVFAYPGIGTLALQAITARDYNLLMGITTISVLILTTSILVMDFVNPLFDPRIRLQ